MGGGGILYVQYKSVKIGRPILKLNHVGVVYIKTRPNIYDIFDMQIIHGVILGLMGMVC